MENKEILFRCTIEDDRKGNEISFSKVKDALGLACLSRLVYLNYYIAKLFIRKCPNLPADRFAVDKIYSRKTDTQGFIIEYPDLVIVTFRGSSSLQDWINDFKIRPITINGINFHRGFYETLDSVYEAIKQRLRSPLSKGKTAHITGHSLGGALATVLTYRLAEDYPQHRHQLKLFAFGAPPTATKGLTEKFEEYGIDTVSVTVIGDLFSYERCSVYKLLHSPPFEYVKPNTAYLPHKGPISSLISHLMGVYISQLKSIQTLKNYYKEYKEEL